MDSQSADERSRVRTIILVLLSLAWPLVIGNIVRGLDDVIVRFWLGRYLGDAGLAVYATVHPVTMMISTFVLAVGIGCSVTTSRAIGAKDGNGLSLAANAALLGLVGSLLIGCSVFWFAPSIAQSLAKDASFVEPVRTFLVPWALLLLPAWAITWVYITTASASGWTRFALMWGVLHLAMSTTALPLFLEYTELGYAAPACSMALTLTLANLALWPRFRAETRARYLHKKLDLSIATSLGGWLRLLNIGLPAQLGRAASYFVFIAMTYHVAGQGKIALAGFGVALACIFFTGGITAAWMRSSVIAIGQALGGGDKPYAREVLKVSLWLTTLGVTSILVAIAQLFSEPILGLFSDDGAVISQGAKSLRWMSWALYPSAAYQILLASFAAVKATKRAAVLILVAQAASLGVLWAWPGEPLVAASLTMFVMFGLTAALLFALAIPVVWNGAMADDDEPVQVLNGESVPGSDQPAPRS